MPGYILFSNVSGGPASSLQTQGNFRLVTAIHTLVHAQPFPYKEARSTILVSTVCLLLGAKCDSTLIYYKYQTVSPVDSS